MKISEVIEFSRRATVGLSVVVEDGCCLPEERIEVMVQDEWGCTNALTSFKCCLPLNKHLFSIN
jgi:hypothetical protein